MRILLFLLPALLGFQARADSVNPVFEKDILPIFTEYCFTCHGQSSPKLGLDLRSAVTTLRGSHNGPVIVKGSPEKSLLFQKVSARAMPPAIYGQKVPDAHIETLKRWISAGAPSDQAAGPGVSEQRARFEKEILPAFTAKCVQCHGQKPMAGLDLRTTASTLKGSQNGPVIVEGFSERSLLVRKVTSNSMPPPGAGQPLTEPEIRALREWIDRGHFSGESDSGNPADRPFTKLEAPEITPEQRNFWAFRKPVAAPTPKPKAANRVRTPIDGFLLAKLESQGLSFSADATDLTLLRRAYFDLTGLPPAPEEIRTFVSDTRPGAYERLIDRLLASPRYGERWGRQWLDAAGYVDTTGKDFDPTKTEYAEGMWRYRDYVIRSFNADKPWDRFLTEQLAGDEMVDWRSEKYYTPETVELLTATGYLRTILDITAEDISNLPVERYEALFKLVEKVSSSTLGLTMGCARCHTHKFDPIPQRDYYRFLSLFSTAYNPSDWLQPQNRYLWSVSKEEKEEIDRYNAEIDGPVAALTKQLDAIRKPYRQRLLDEKLKLLPESIREDAKAAVETPKEKRNEVQKYLFGKFGTSLQTPEAEILKQLTAADKAAVEKLETQIRTWKGYRRKLEKVQALWDVGAPPSMRLLQRGSAESPGPGVTPGFPEVLCPPGSAEAVRAKDTQGKTAGIRLAFAHWLVNRENPLTARVIVNRIWQGHFGMGIVATPDNFGKMGAPPSNQELLDRLAVDFMEHGWKAKWLHKTIMMSTAYRQSSRQGSEPWVAKAKVADPENRLLWRMNLLRLDAETLRDSVIAAAGMLDTTMGGEPIRLSMQPDGLQVVSEKEPPSARWRRSIYLTSRRNYPLSFLNVFDFPAIDTNCTRRAPSATPLQSLTMMNDSFMLESAGRLAARAEEMAGRDAPAAKKIEAAYQLVFARKPKPDETKWGEDHLEKQQALYTAANDPRPQAASKAFSSLVQMLLSSNEFLYVD
ncbi:MAG TPA: PSD1 and planctomycete cytochrome C domain-containing protein [Bryobacteraceae bacterium]|nr:PSD1 and planctomycete cytochrome C domain-containing protein [Bryobacteraceae bacterium]